MRVQESEIRKRVERFREACTLSGVRLTHQRLEIFREVAGTGDHPDVEAIWKGVRKRMPTVSLDTVYRTLWLLNDIGAIATLGLPRERIRFDANTSPHHHYVCVRCGLTRDFESDEFNALQIPAEVGEFGSVLAAQVEVRGLCAACTQESGSEEQAASPHPLRGRKAT